MMATEKRLISVVDCPCDGCEAKPCGHPARCVKFALWLNKTVDAVVLPCKIGDKVYRIDKGNYHSNWKPFIQELTVTEISWKKEKYGDKDLGFAIIADGIRYKFTSIGKSVFLTRKEAEAKMDGERKDND
jgi:hypothetical protein